jgi:RNA polymerase sigma factor for flagellar operon FliA
MTEKEQSNSIDEIWLKYKESPSFLLRNQLVLHYLSLVKSVLKTIRLPQNTLLTSNDLINYGIIGLIDAIEKFEPIQNVKFETYAYQRIRGAIIDEIRRLDWLSRSERHKAKNLIKTIDQSYAETGEASVEELSKRLNVSEDELRKYFSAYQSSQNSFFITETFSVDEDEDDLPFVANISTEEKNALDDIVDNEKIEIIYNFLKSLPERERLIITLYYYENLKFKEIGVLLELSESRVSQIHSAVIKKLRQKFKELEE